MSPRPVGRRPVRSSSDRSQPSTVRIVGRSGVEGTAIRLCCLFFDWWSCWATRRRAISRARSPTSPPSSSIRRSRSTRARTSTRSASSCTNCCAGRRRSRARHDGSHPRDSRGAGSPADRNRGARAGAAAGHRAEGDGTPARRSLPRRRRRWRSISTRYLEGRPVLARPTQYASTLDARVRPHLDQIARVAAAQAHLSARGGSAAVGLQAARGARRRLDRLEPRPLVLADRALLRRVPAARRQPVLFRRRSLRIGAVKGLLRPVPRAGRAVRSASTSRAGISTARSAAPSPSRSSWPASACCRSSCSSGSTRPASWVAAADAPNQLFDDGSVSNRQLQVTILSPALWSGWLALRTRTSALSTVFTLLAFLLDARAAWRRRPPLLGGRRSNTIASRCTSGRSPRATRDGAGARARPGGRGSSGRSTSATRSGTGRRARSARARRQDVLLPRHSRCSRSSRRTCRATL